MNPRTARDAWAQMLAADQAAFAVPHRRRKRSMEALRATEARIDFVLACQRTEQEARKAR